MTIRLSCPECLTTFLTTDERLGQIVSCPKCGSSARMPATMEEVARLASGPKRRREDPPASPAVVDPVEDDHPDDRRRRRLRRLVPFVLGALAGLGVATLVLLPLLRRPEPTEAEAPRPMDPVERTARAFLDALVSRDIERIELLSTLTDPPAIASFDDAQRDPEGDETIRGSFAPIAALHRTIAESYTYDPAIGRFQNANPLGVAAEFLDEADRARQENEQADVYSRIAGGSADEQLDAAIEFAESFARLTQALPRRELVPTYEQLVRDAEPPLPPDAQALALRFGEDPDTWDDLLGRPFFTIEADGPFVLEEAEVVATVEDTLAAAGSPARRLRLRLLRFRLDAIDTGWKVVAARREDVGPSGPEPSPGAFESPGQTPSP
ncbi:TFIIB-type zinc ribbon-containing protein [Tautonia sociabilis]|uniref:TFIIB-type zinc ribbon-containing protein n=1 Tax=Tautonia sociabilis TaxID=2080755 RepID=A0A432MPE7_9BACT|nr:TFIIB-type zinc ribbon-containing protein [Tautonia sociabilis]RUL88965.1 TFIIB-type zinc ribbon-containing protein [Tautonia sociabilis]